MQQDSPAIMLAIGGSDSCAGAGVQADLKTATALGVYCCTAITAVTAQNFASVKSLGLQSPDLLEAQLDCLAEQLDFAVIKLGMLGSVELAQIALNFAAQSNAKLVVDPVLGSTSGRGFADDALLEIYRSELVDRAELLTPNISEAAKLLGVEHALDEEQALSQAQSLLNLGFKAVLIKGGHLSGKECIDQLVAPGVYQRIASKRIDSIHTHGSGCTLASAISAYLARGEPLQRACELAKQFIGEAILRSSNMNLVENNGPLDQYQAGRMLEVIGETNER